MHWKDYEKEVFAYLQREFPEYEILSDEYIQGRYSGVPRQIDILLNGSLLKYNIRGVADCKCFSKKVDVKTVDQLVGYMADTDAHIGILITNEGFTPAAEERAAKDPQTIHLEVVSFKQLHDWKFDYLSVLVPTMLSTLSEIPDSRDEQWTSLISDIGRYFDAITPHCMEDLEQLSNLDQMIIDILSTAPFDKVLESIAESIRLKKEVTAVHLSRLVDSGYIVKRRNIYSISQPAFVVWHLIRSGRERNVITALTDYLSGIALSRNYRNERYVAGNLRRITNKKQGVGKTRKNKGSKEKQGVGVVDRVNSR